MKPDYKIMSLDMVAPRDRTLIVERGLLVTSVTVLSNPVGMGAEIAFYEQGDLAPVQQQGMTFKKICTTEGVFLTNPPTGGVLQLAVTFGSLTVQGG